MKLINKFCVYTKRILLHRLYVLMLALIIGLTVIYQFLPEKNKTTDIKVAMYFEEDNELSEKLLNEIESLNSVYTFYYVENEAVLIDEVKKGYAECGYVIPKNFFDDYIHGRVEDNPIRQYVIPSSTLHYSINETIFCKILKVCADKILIQGVDNPEYNDELARRLHDYVNSDSVFTLTTPLTGEIKYKEIIYKLELPIYETSLILIIFSGFLGLLMYYTDRERGMYDALSTAELVQNRTLSVATALIPIYIIGSLSVIFIYGFTRPLLSLTTYTILTFIAVLLSSLIIRKSTLLIKVLPLITFISTIIMFISTLM